MEQLYQHKTVFYKDGRLGYSEEAIQLITGLIPSAHAVIADMGSGTGLFSEPLLKKGCAVYCVEPDRALQQKARENLHHFERFTAVDAPAENTGLKAHSVDAITAASAFHWFEPTAFLRECKRILKPNGPVFIIYNVRQTGDPFSQEQEQICRQYCPTFTGFHHGADKAKNSCPAFFTQNLEEKQYTHDLTYTKEQFLSRCLSSSYSLTQNHPRYLAYQQALQQCIAAYSTDGLITVPNRTVLWYGLIHS